MKEASSHKHDITPFKYKNRTGKTNGPKTDIEKEHRMPFWINKQLVAEDCHAHVAGARSAYSRSESQKWKSM